MKVESDWGRVGGGSDAGDSGWGRGSKERMKEGEG